MINCIIAGRMTKNPELRKVTINGVETSVLDFTVAADNGFRRDEQGNKKNLPQFFRVTAWRGAAESIAKYGSKGREITVTGAVELLKYTDPNTQKDVYYLGIRRMEQFEFHGGATQSSASVDNVPPTMDDAAAPVAAAPVAEEEVPW